VISLGNEQPWETTDIIGRDDSLPQWAYSDTLMTVRLTPCCGRRVYAAMHAELYQRAFYQLTCL